MRRRDYRCTACDFLFEFVDSMNDPIHEHLPCPECKSPAKRQMATGVHIGKIDRGTFVTDFPGPIGPDGKPTRITLGRDEVERRLAAEPPKPFEGDTGLGERIGERLDRLIAKEAAGELKPRPELTTEQKDAVQKVLKTGT